MNEPSPVIGAVPPVAETSTVAVPPLHRIGAVSITLAVILQAIYPTIVHAVVEHPLASVIVKQKFPVNNPVAGDVGVIVYGAVPPVIVDTVAVPSAHVKQEASVLVADAASTAGSETVINVDEVQPLASVTV